MVNLVNASEESSSEKLETKGQILTNHQAIVKQAVIVQLLEPTALLAEQHTGHNSRTRGSQATAQRNGVDNVDVRLDGEAALVVAAEDVEGHAGQQVDVRVEADFTGALSFVGDSAVERVRRRRLGAVNGDVQLEVHGQREANHVEARANVGR